MTADEAAELEAFNTHSQCKEQAQDDDHRHETLSANIASTKDKEELSPAEDEAEAGYLNVTQQKKPSKGQDVKYKEAKSSGSKESAGELASDRDPVSAGLECLIKSNDRCVARAITNRGALRVIH